MSSGGVFIAVAVFWPMIAAVLGCAIGGKNRRAGDIFAFAACLLTLMACLALAIWRPGAQLSLSGFGSIRLSFEHDGFRSAFGCITGFLWVVTTLFSPGYFSLSDNMRRYRLFNLLTLGAVMGMSFSADFVTAFVFFEMLSLTSYPLVAHDQSPSALRAAETYLAVAIFGGLSILMGMLILNQRVGTLEFSRLYEICSAMADKSGLYLPGALLLIGFGAKAGMFPLHIWLPKAHPAAPAPASALLSGILIKTGVFGVAAVGCNIFPYDYSWSTALLVFASVTMLLGAVLAVFSNDLKRTLACSSVSQMGFVIIGIAMQSLLGEHGGIAVRGTILHMMNHSLIKLLLFLSAGVVYMNRHELNLDKLRGFGRGKPLVLFVFTMAALGLVGLPLWSGYISKTLLHESIVEGAHLLAGSQLGSLLHVLDVSFIFAGGLTIAYTLRLFVTLFVEKSGDDRECPGFGHSGGHGAGKAYIGRIPAIALALTAALLPALGSFPSIMDALADSGQDFFHGHAPDNAIHYFAWVNLKGFAFSAAVGVLVYFLVVRGILVRKNKDGRMVAAVLWPRRLDLEDLVYRPLLKRVLAAAVYIMRSVASLPDRLLLVFFRRSHPSRDEQNVSDRFSIGLILAGAGVCITLLYVLFQAL